VQRVTRLLLEGRGDQLPVSAFPPDGTWPTGTARYEKRALALEIPIWDPDLCVQCNFCSTICPHTAIRTSVFEPEAAAGAPPTFRSVPETYTPELQGLSYLVQVAPDDCTGCGLCVEVCPAKDRTNPRRKAITMQPVEEHREAQREAFAFSLSLPEIERRRVPHEKNAVSLLPSLFEFSGACSGCGETPYIRLLTQLFGDRLVIANATGCSSIYGGNLPTTPYTTNHCGQGPAWSNSLFEDNAEFGLGLRLGIDALRDRALHLLKSLAGVLPDALLSQLLAPCSSDEQALHERRAAVAVLKQALSERKEPAAQELHGLADELVPRSLWIVGGDGWAYDIGYGGLDHVLSTHHKVNVLVLDTEVYSNTGGQQSKATPLGASAKFASAGKESRKKDLGLLAMTYGHVYVASIAMQARSRQTIKAFLEAESHPGPALLIAHSPCIAHGYDLIKSPTQQRLAIESGAWPLYRFDPGRVTGGLPPLQIDADPLKTPLRRYMEEEARFRMVALRDPERFEHLLRQAERAVHERHELYAQLSQIRLPQGDDRNA
jgi:pyruvate-ferredoxin/flavodoxin oxidoreductase